MCLLSKITADGIGTDIYIFIFLNVSSPQLRITAMRKFFFFFFSEKLPFSLSNLTKLEIGHTLAIQKKKKILYQTEFQLYVRINT